MAKKNPMLSIGLKFDEERNPRLGGILRDISRNTIRFN
ncbi:hypothetical protein ALQ64_00203 [Pseudomonas cannabina]|uniref:Uncharacterized protein n=2 Tax=Pseudomonas syringae group TaxID=136849 RepID=A0A3M3KBA4_PSECA|nr:hypothetical protein ALQ64_00203 [Pseudomonas cannabina]